MAIVPLGSAELVASIWIFIPAMISLFFVDVIKEIAKKEKVIFSGINTEKIDVSEYQNGIYFVNLQIGAQVTTKKLVITN